MAHDGSKIAASGAHWLVDLNSPCPSKPKFSSSIPNPPGYSETSIGKRSANQKTSTRKPPTTAETDLLKVKKSWEIALAPAKALPMNAIMMYMSGNSLQIFSIMMVFMLFKNPVTAILSTNDVFSKFETEGTRKNIWVVKSCYIAMNLLALSLGLWKINGMGLLPTTRSDWLAWETQRQTSEKAVFAII